jgi:hypothetical protein
LLDLRSWRWRSGAFLQRQPGSSADDDECLLNMGVVMHEGQVLAIGGRHYWKVPGIWWHSSLLFDFDLMKVAHRLAIDAWVSEWCCMRCTCPVGR